MPDEESTQIGRTVVVDAACNGIVTTLDGGVTPLVEDGTFGFPTRGRTAGLVLWMRPPEMSRQPTGLEATWSAD